MPLRRILIPLDGSSNSDLIAGWAVGLASAIGADVHLLTVVQVPISIEPGAAHTEEISSARETASEYLAKRAASWGESGVTITHEVRTGDPSREILCAAAEPECDLVAMATHRGSALARGVLGSVTIRVMLSSPVPVMVVYPASSDVPRTPDHFETGPGGPASVLLPLDGSKESETAFAPALELAASCDAELVLVTVAPPISDNRWGTETLAIASYGIDPSRDIGAKYLSSFGEQAAAESVTAKPIVTSGIPAEEIVKLSKTYRSPMIVMSTRGRDNSRDWLIGSVTDKVVRSSDVPVIVVPVED